MPRIRAVHHETNPIVFFLLAAASAAFAETRIFTAAITVAFSGSAPHTLTVTYGGDDNFETSSTTIQIVAGTGKRRAVRP